MENFLDSIENFLDQENFDCGKLTFLISKNNMSNNFETIKT